MEPMIIPNLRNAILLTDPALLAERPNGIEDIFASNGIFRRAASKTCTITVPVGTVLATDGTLHRGAVGVVWHSGATRLPADLLTAIARDGFDALPNERQWFVVERDGDYAVVVPQQRAARTAVRYTPPDIPVLVDVHSHGHALACFSSTDDTDDQGVGVAVVMGTLDTVPTISVRLCCYGLYHPVHPATIFAGDLSYWKVLL